MQLHIIIRYVKYSVVHFRDYTKKVFVTELTDELFYSFISNMVSRFLYMLRKTFIHSKFSTTGIYLMLNYSQTTFMWGKP